MNAEVLASAIVGHLVGDYLLQNDWMALNKKNDASICLIHCTIWVLCVSLFSGWIFYQNFTGGLIGLILFVTHFVQDHTNVIAWWMRLIGQRKFMQADELDMMTFKIIPGLGPWSIIVVDNVWHIFTIWIIWRFIA